MSLFTSKFNILRYCNAFIQKLGQIVNMCSDYFNVFVINLIEGSLKLGLSFGNKIGIKKGKRNASGMTKIYTCITRNHRQF